MSAARESAAQAKINKLRRQLTESQAEVAHLRDLSERRKRFIIRWVGALPADIAGLSVPSTEATERGDLPHINCLAYSTHSDRDHDAHVHRFTDPGTAIRAWCQGRPTSEGAES